MLGWVGGRGRSEGDAQFHGLFFFDGWCEHVEEGRAFRGLWGAGGFVYFLREVGVTRCMRSLDDGSCVGTRAGGG